MVANKMSENLRILITGSQGFIGSTLSKSLREVGYEVWGIDSKYPTNEFEIRASMLDINEITKALYAIPHFSTIIHTAALAHGQRPPYGETCLSMNIRISNNLLKALCGQNVTRFIFLSSVAVYGEDGRNELVSVDNDLRPATDYGKSKVICEQSILASHIQHCEILRLTPVFDEKHMADVGKRVFFLGLPFVKIRLLPPPSYSFCHIQTLTQVILKLLSHQPNGQRIYNVADPEPYDQHRVLSWFPGRAIPLPIFLVQPLYAFARLIPGKKGYALRCMLWKLFYSKGFLVNLPGE